MLLSELVAIVPCLSPSVIVLLFVFLYLCVRLGSKLQLVLMSVQWAVSMIRVEGRMEMCVGSLSC